MAFGTLKFDTLTTSDSANTSTEKSLDTSYVFNGVAKHWSYFSMAGTSYADSFNTSSLEDSATGRFNVTMTSAFSDTNYSMQFTSNAYAGNSAHNQQSTAVKFNLSTTVTTTKFDCYTSGNSSDVDATYNYTLGHGDLA